MNLRTAQTAAAQLLILLATPRVHLHVAGSLRRLRPEIKDIEFVAHGDIAALWRTVDRLINTGALHKHNYGTAFRPMFRWGERYRGLSWQDIQVEVFAADSHNFGYIHWLRTGPSAANEFVMRYVLGEHRPLQARDGYIWHDGRRVSVPDEQTLFNLFGWPYIDPQHRSEEVYCNLRTNYQLDSIAYVPDPSAPHQRALF